MSNKLGATLGQAYRGTRAFQPPNYEFNDVRTPDFRDWANYALGDLWFYPYVDNSTGTAIDTAELWWLASKAGDSNSRGSKGLWLKLAGGFGNVVAIDTDNGLANPSNGIINLFAHPLAGGTVEFSVVPSGINTINFSVTDGSANIAIGALSGYGISGSANTILGYSCGVSLTSGQLNTIVGFNSGFSLITSTNNTILGAFSGNNYQTNESGNILLGSAVFGTTGESNVLRIGAGTGTNAAIGNLNKAIIAGIYNRPIGLTSGVVLCDNTDVLGSSNGANGQVLIGGDTGPEWANITSTGGTITITNGPNTINIDTAGSIADSYPTDSGTAVPAAGVLNVLGTANEIATSGAGNTITIGLDPNFYAAGSWTPTLRFGGTAVASYDDRGGSYTRIGNIIFITASIDMSSKGGATGAATITGIPIAGIAINAHQDFQLQSGRGLTFDAGFTTAWGNMDGGSTIILNEGGFPATFQGLADTNFANNAQITIQGFYYVA
jgi:hypothetical protein